MSVRRCGRRIGLVMYSSELSVGGWVNSSYSGAHSMTSRLQCGTAKRLHSAGSSACAGASPAMKRHFSCDQLNYRVKIHRQFRLGLQRTTQSNADGTQGKRTLHGWWMTKVMMMTLVKRDDRGRMVNQEETVWMRELISQVMWCITKRVSRWANKSDDRWGSSITWSKNIFVQNFMKLKY